VLSGYILEERIIFNTANKLSKKEFVRDEVWPCLIDFGLTKLHVLFV